ncbi:MAG: MlaA family lipoprotein, partial [Legionellales bacterium]
MRLNPFYAGILSSFMMVGCAHKGANPIDPFEPFNRKVHAFNTTIDGMLLKPSAKFYVAVVPGKVRKAINNAYNNLDLVPSVANDLLQAQGKWAIKDTWRFLINSTLGLAGFLDVAQTFGLPPHSNDLGLT